MAIYKNTPPIITSGLTLYLDAANSKSYVTGSTVWNDVSGLGNSGSFVNGPGFSTDGGGSITFNGSTTSISNFPIQISGTGSKTVSCFFKTFSTNRSGLVGTRNTLGSNGWMLGINNTSIGTLAYFHVGGSGESLISPAGLITTGRWFNGTATYDLATTTVILYINGTQVDSINTFNNMAASAVSGSIGTENGSSNLNGNIATTLIYNRALSAAEVRQNYNALKTRFGLT